MTPGERLMARAIELAERGRRFTHPNPLVGAVIACDGAIVGEGWHAACGKPHAEVEAIEDARRHGFARWADAVLYVTLEPCCHTGRTPPCTEAIRAAGIGTVVYALEDPDPRVNGGGEGRLRAGGIRVTAGMLRDAAACQNEAYLHHRRTGLPFVTWKTVRTPDGATSWRPGERTRVSGPETDREVDVLRAVHDAVLIGGATVRIDDPGLRVRERAALPPALRELPDPVRVVLTGSGDLPPDARLLTENADARTLLLAGSSAEARVRSIAGGRAEVMGVAEQGGRIEPAAALRALADRGILSILAECGDELGQTLLSAGLVSRLEIFEAPIESAPPGWSPSARSCDDLPVLPGTRTVSACGRDRRTRIDLAPHEAA